MITLTLSTDQCALVLAGLIRESEQNTSPVQRARAVAIARYVSERVRMLHDVGCACATCIDGTTPRHGFACACADCAAQRRRW